MTWQTDIDTTVRVLINDLTSTLYSDAQLEKVIIVAANQVINETDFDTVYVASISIPSITPDPTDPSIMDASFVALVSLKAASLIARGEMKLAANASGFIIKDSVSTVDTSNYYLAASTLYKQFIADYEFLKMNYKFIRSVTHCQAIMTPTVVTNIYTSLQVLGY